MNEAIDKNFPAVMSRFQLVILAGLRSKQLLQGAHPRILADPLKKRNTSIALEELKRGLVRFKGRTIELLQNGDVNNPVINVSLLEQGSELKLVEAV